MGGESLFLQLFFEVFLEGVWAVLDEVLEAFRKPGLLTKELLSGSKMLLGHLREAMLEG